MCSTNDPQTKENPTSEDPIYLKRSSLNSVMLTNNPGRGLTEHNSHWLSYVECLNKFDFSNRFDADEVEWALNQPLDIIDGRTCIHVEVLAKRNNVDKLVSLLTLGGSPNIRDTAIGQSPLHYACTNKAIKNRYSILKALLDYGGDMYQRDNNGKTPLSVLQNVDSTLYTTIVQKHLFTGCKVDDFRAVEKLHQAVQQHGPLEDFKKLYSTFPNENSRMTDLGQHTLLFRACKEGWIDGVSFILSKIVEAPPSNQVTNETPLHAACEENHYEIVEQLIALFPELLLIKDKLPYRGWYPIHTACAYGASDKILSTILEGMQRLMETKEDDLPNTKVDVHVDLIDELGRSPLHIATKCGNLSHVELMTSPCWFNTLQQYFPSLYAITPGNPSQISIIHCAVAHNRKEILEVLLDKFPLAIHGPSAYPSIFSLAHMLSHMERNIKGLDVKPVMFPLLETTICERSDGKLSLSTTSKAFEEYEVLSNIQLSPLAVAAAMINEEMIEMLLNAGARDDDGLALRIAIFLQCHKIVRMLSTVPDDATLCLGAKKKLFAFSLPIEMLDNFSTIDLQHNHLNSVPLALFQCEGLQDLNVSYNQITELPVVDISSSSEVFASSWRCRSIKALNVSYNKLTTLPAILWKLTELKKLHVQNNSLTSIETSVEVCLRLEEIDFSHNNLQSVPECVFRAKTVNISHNTIQCLPKCIWNLEYLNTLVASNNQIAEIMFPRSACSGNHDQRLTSFTSKGIKKLSAEGNPSFFMNKSLQKIYGNSCHGLSKLDLSHNNLTKFPTDLACFATNLERLYISGNNIPVLYICFLPPFIKHLDAKNCNLEMIETSYDDKAYICCHKTHTSLNNLLYLYLKGNCFKQFTFINYSHVPVEKNLRFPGLKLLDLSKNQLRDQLDQEVGLQKDLTTLILSDNPNLRSLPLELSYLSNTLTHLELDNLPGLKDPPKEYILAKSPKRLLSYMKSRIKSSVQYRMLDLIIVGGSKKGKTSLLKSLNKGLKKEKCQSDEINIYDWEYSPPTGGGPDVVFRMWDFPSKEYNATINYCFYSKQALYLVVFNLRDGDHGVKELDSLLKNIKVHAPGCPVMLIGTHLENVNVKKDESERIQQLYCDDSLYPTIADVSFISNTEHSHTHGTMKTLRHQIYCVAMNLHTNRKNKLTLKTGQAMDDPDALLQQYIPKLYLSLQKEIEKKSKEMKQKNLAPLMNKAEFHENFHSLFEDEEELASAVQFLHCQRKLFHFEDPLLITYYFLDLQWIFNTMANIMKIQDSNGMILANKLMAQSSLVIPESLQSGFLALLAKFDFAIPCKNNYKLVYGLLPKQLELSAQLVPIPVKKEPTLVEKSPFNKLRKTLKKRSIKAHSKNSEKSDVIVFSMSNNLDDDYNASTNSITKSMNFTDTLYDNHANKEKESKGDDSNEAPDSSTGFKRTLTPSSLPHNNSSVHHPKSFPRLSVVDSLTFEAATDLHSPQEIPSFGVFPLKTTYSNPGIHPNLHRVWPASFVPDGFWPQLFTRIISDSHLKSIISIILFTPLKNNECTLDYVQSSNVPPVWKLYQKGFTVEHETVPLLQLKQVSSNHSNSTDQFTNQIELTIHVCEIMLTHKTYKENESDWSAENVIKLATRILVLIEQHILDIVEEWYPNISCSKYNREVLSFVPCYACLNTSRQNTLLSVSSNHKILCFDNCKAISFSMKDLLIANAQQSRTIKCPLHSELNVQLLAPDMCFQDLEEDMVCGPDIQLTIDKDRVLGQGGHALVLRGEILDTNKDHQRKLVAVKIIRDGVQKLTDFLDGYTTCVKDYRMIRKEVLFLSTLHHHNLTQLCGLRTNPFMILIELAPLGSLGSILKQFRSANQVLTPAVLQASVYQVASALAFLHEKNVVYFDLKSDNVLAWRYPLPAHQNTDEDVLLKITDYGISRICGAAQDIRCTTAIGTPGFIAPEVLESNRKDLKSDKIDVFSFGMFLYELITLSKPFEYTEHPDKLIRKKERPKIPESKERFTPCIFQQIMKNCWNHDPMERPSMAQVVQWSQLPELISLRLQYHLEPINLLSTGQCLVLRDHVHEYTMNKPSNIKFTLPYSENAASDHLFSDKFTYSPKAERRQSTANHHSQVWIAQEKGTTSKVTILTFRSSDLGYYVHEDDTTAKVVTMENVGNYMWVKTNDYKLHVIHTASMKTVACVPLENSLLEVSHLLHVPEWHMVLVLWELPEIWCLHDEVDASGLHVIGTLQLESNNPMSNWCKVTLDSTTEVWCTRKDKQITILAETLLGGCCEKATLQCSTDCKLATPDLISCLHFNTDSEDSLIHVWTTFDESSQLISWNGETKSQIQSVALQCTGKATSLLGHKNHLYIGTSAGTVEVFESKSGCFLTQFSWHANVNALLMLPLEIKQSICAELSPTKCLKLTHRQSFQDDQIVPKKRVSQEALLQRSVSGSQLPKKQQSTSLIDSPLIVSIGNGLADHLLSIKSTQASMFELIAWTGIT